MKKFTITIGILLALPLIAMAHGDDEHMEGWGHMMGFGFWPFGTTMWIPMVLFWAIAIVSVAVLIKWLAGQSRDDHAQSASLEELKKRYAKGEIDKAEFDKIKKDLD